MSHAILKCLFLTIVGINLCISQVLHQLAAHAIIRDWKDGSLAIDADQTQHGMVLLTVSDTIFCFIFLHLL